jgi:hypothetical protein
MTEDQRTQARAALLLQLHAASPQALRLDTLHTGLQLAGHTKLNPSDTLAELDALIELGHIGVSNGTFNATQKEFKLREAGRVALVEAGLV